MHCPKVGMILSTNWQKDSGELTHNILTYLIQCDSTISIFFLDSLHVDMIIAYDNCKIKQNDKISTVLDSIYKVSYCAHLSNNRK